MPLQLIKHEKYKILQAISQEQKGENIFCYYLQDLDTRIFLDTKKDLEAVVKFLD